MFGLLRACTEVDVGPRSAVGHTLGGPAVGTTWGLLGDFPHCLVTNEGEVHPPNSLPEPR
eukprot:376878-Pelagomonas_calceolata.AAC.6